MTFDEIVLSICQKHWAMYKNKWPKTKLIDHFPVSRHSRRNWSVQLINLEEQNVKIAGKPLLCFLLYSMHYPILPFSLYGQCDDYLSMFSCSIQIVNKWFKIYIHICRIYFSNLHVYNVVIYMYMNQSNTFNLIHLPSSIYYDCKYV